MTNIVVNKSTGNAEPLSICEVYHLQKVSGNPGSFVNGHDFLVRSTGNFPGAACSIYKFSKFQAIHP